MLTPNTLLQNRYRILRHIGGGGMGMVYLADDNRLPGRTCAVKEMSPDQLPPDDRTWATNAFRQEAQMLARLSHSGLTSVTDFFPEEGNLYLVMDYVRGETLEEMLEQAPNERLPQGQVLNVVRQLCDVLQYLHGQDSPVIFRDLKPSNVMLTPEGQVKLIDFGIARLFKATKSQDTVTLGTPGYAAPEQWGTAGQSDVRSDIYGLGVLLLRLTTGYDPTPNPFPLPQPRALMPKISPKIEYLILRATPAQPSARYQSIAELRRDMDTPSERLKPQEKTEVLTSAAHPPTPPPAPAAYSTPYPPQAKPYPQPAPAPKRTGLWIGMGIGGVLLIGLCAAVLGGALAMPAIFGAPTTRPPTIEQATAPPPPTAAPATGPAPTTPPESPVPPPSEQPPTAPPTTEPTVDTSLRWSNIGQSVRGRDLEVATIGDRSGAAVVVVGSIQGDQPNTRDLLDYLIDDFDHDQQLIPANVAFHFISTINPDGNTTGTRRNAHNVDLNRNWDTFDWTANPEQPGGVVRGAGGSRPHSELETQSLADYLLSLQRQNPNLRLVLWHSSQRISSSGHVYPGYTSSGLDSNALTLAWRYADAT
ncbi:MAG: protein kinase, partial [Chloroflexota bacterium]|nr:protein kinase [Chloroflexota bacterium]